MISKTVTAKQEGVSGSLSDKALRDYGIACLSREASLIGRKEVFMGKAKFGIFGDGKEIAQLAMSHVFREGDFRAGYYRDQTFMLAIGELTLHQYFAQLYAHTDVEADPASAGRSMNCHFATRMIDEHGQLKDLVNRKNSSADISPTAAQMPRLLGLAYASKLFRNNPELNSFDRLSVNGNEVAFGSIGDASTSEGVFFETINAAGVLQVPMLISVWDDGYGISVPKKYQTTKESISAALRGFQRTDSQPGFEIFTVRGWDYKALCETYEKAVNISRKEHVPVLVHVTEVTQPQGHSTSGSHERYKTKERLQWEKSHDCILKMREWMIEEEIASADELDEIEEQSKLSARAIKKASWDRFMEEIVQARNEVIDILQDVVHESPVIGETIAHLKRTTNLLRMDVERAVRVSARVLLHSESNARSRLLEWLKTWDEQNNEKFNSHLYSSSSMSAGNVKGIQAEYSDQSPLIDGREVLSACFRAAFSRDARILAFGEDVGKIGDVNQGLAGFQKEFGAFRVTDTGIRECTIIGQGIGVALRGLRPIAEVQYLDYILYALQIMSDDLATLHYRTKGGQKAPVIVRTRGHRLEGIWHAGSPMGMLLHALRGMLILVPRNMTQAAGFYNTLFQSDDPALIIECLNGYRLKERLPDNIAEFTVPVGVPEVLKSGHDVTIVTYGSMCRVVMEAASDLLDTGIDCEVLDVQSLLPFDVHHLIVKSLQKTGRIVFADEDVPGGATSFMMQQVLEVQGGYQYLDACPVTITAKDHRPAYGSDGDYYSKPNPEMVFDRIYSMMHEADPRRFPSMY